MLINHHGIEYSSISIVRPDGQTLASVFKNKLEQKRLQATLGVLVSGSWQAAMEASRLVGHVNESDFRFSFENSESGVHILPLAIDSDIWFVCLTFSKVLNPARVKVKLRNLKDDIVTLIKAQLEESNSRVSEKEIFMDLKDSEIDDAFSRIRI
jgi:hypothetical protein